MSNRSDKTAEASDNIRTLSRRKAFRASGVLLGGVSLLTGTAAATGSSAPVSVTRLMGTEKADAVHLALDSVQVEQMRERLETTRDLSVDDEAAEAYLVSTPRDGYTVVSLFPRYPRQSRRTVTNNVVALIKDGSVTDVTALVSEYKSLDPERIHTYIVEDESVVKETTTIDGSPHSEEANVAGLSSRLRDRFEEFESTPGLAALPYLTPVDHDRNPHTLNLASTVGASATP
jgi:hypothetical protein